MRYTLEAFAIRTRGWIRTVLHLGAIALFLLGAFALYRAHTIEGVLQPALIGYDVPAVAGFDPYETMLYGGFLAMMLGLGLCYRWFVAGPGAHHHYH